MMGKLDLQGQSLRLSHLDLARLPEIASRRPLGGSNAE